jgi:CheY-like chemotaxis protein
VTWNGVVAQARSCAVHPEPAADRPDRATPSRRILVVEDEFMVALMMEQMLEELGCTVVGPAGGVEEALEIAAREPIDAALLDVNLHGVTAFPVADELARRKIPFAFVTAFGPDYDFGSHRRHPVIAKPFRVDDVKTVLDTLLPAPAA